MDCGCADGSGKSGIDPIDEGSEPMEELVSGRASLGETQDGDRLYSSSFQYATWGGCWEFCEVVSLEVSKKLGGFTGCSNLSLSAELYAEYWFCAYLELGETTVVTGNGQDCWAGGDR